MASTPGFEGVEATRLTSWTMMCWQQQTEFVVLGEPEHRGDLRSRAAEETALPATCSLR